MFRDIFDRDTWNITRRYDRTRRVYFIQYHTGELKVGISKDPQRRLKQLRTLAPGAMHLIAMTDGGGLELESEFKKAMKDYQIHHEWYSPLRPVWDWIFEHCTWFAEGVREH